MNFYYLVSAGMSLRKWYNMASWSPAVTCNLWPASSTPDIVIDFIQFVKKNVEEGLLLFGDFFFLIFRLQTVIGAAFAVSVRVNKNYYFAIEWVIGLLLLLVVIDECDMVLLLTSFDSVYFPQK